MRCLVMFRKSTGRLHPPDQGIVHPSGPNSVSIDFNYNLRTEQELSGSPTKSQ